MELGTFIQMAALVPWEDFVFVDKFPTYVDMKIDRDHALGRDKNGLYTIRFRGWMIEEGEVKDSSMTFLETIPRMDDIRRKKWAARWVDWELIEEGHALAQRRLEFLRKNIMSPAFRPFFTTREAMQHVKDNPKDIILRLSTTYSGVLTLTYAVCDECPVCMECETTVVVLRCNHVLGSTCWQRIAPRCPICRDSTMVTETINNATNENLEIDAHGNLVLMTSSLVYQLKFVANRTFESPASMQAAFLGRASSNQRDMKSTDVTEYAMF